MISAGYPQDRRPGHTFPPGKHVLKHRVEGVPHVERAGYIRRRNDEGIGRTLREGGRLEIPLRNPILIPLLLDAFWMKTLV
jgi:hypothetical protein